MSAHTDQQADLTRWAMAQRIRHDGFLPRSAFGQYLCEMLASAERAAAPTGTISRITADVVGLARSGPREPWHLCLATGGDIQADAVVLATGNRPPPPPCLIPDTLRYVADAWAPGALDQLSDGSRVAVVGTGLTMLDVAITATGAHPATTVLAVSRHGLIPRAHTLVPCIAGAPRPSELGVTPPTSLPALIRAVRTAAVEAPDGWQAVVDSIRPEVPRLWQSLTPRDRRLFLRHVARYWEVHRHRAPPATAHRIEGLICSGRLHVVSGQVVAVQEERHGLRISIEHRDGRASFGAGWLVNATGPAGDIGDSPDPLLRQLISSGLAVPDALRLGITADREGAVLDRSGTASDSLFTLGPPLRGQLYESTAIPEIRDQAARLASRLMSGSGARVAAESAA